ncbi:hypothetical protein CK556_02830 [Mesoplasma chauliocola]|uniref:Uncharacterized protein n=1 Tax=Mesoplasma chauliocola TaxID=216427 RepID=A0A249SNV0_9MOLU|nr:hypothetical protein [Mesoplasma chauliocola]ASZ09273.1 hypothetical protein CK556_02830 [Mesoplasma chauliocola]
MKKTITLLAAVGIVSGASTSIVSCSFMGDKDKGKTTDPKTKDIEVSQVLLKKEVQDLLNNQIFNSKEDAIKVIENKKDWDFKGLETIKASIYGSNKESINIKAKLKNGYVWMKATSGEFSVSIGIDNTVKLKQISEEISKAYFDDIDSAKTNIINKFEEVNGIKTVEIIEQTKMKSQFSFEVELTYEGNITGPKKQSVIINLKNNLATDVYAVNESVSKNNKKYNNKLEAERYIISSLKAINGVSNASVSWDQYAPLRYTTKISYDESAYGPKTQEGSIVLRKNLASSINSIKNKLEAVEYKNSVDPKANFINELDKLEGIDKVEFIWVNEDTYEYKINLTYNNDYFGPSSISGTLTKYKSAQFEEIQTQQIDMRLGSSIIVDVKGKNLESKNLQATSSDASVKVSYSDQKLTITSSKNDNFETVIKLWDTQQSDESVEFKTIVVPKPELATTINSEYGWYLNREKVEEIWTRNFDNNKNDNFEYVTQLTGIEGNVEDYIDISLKHDGEDQQKFYFRYKFKKMLPVEANIQIGLKINNQVVASFKLKLWDETNISTKINSILEEIKEKNVYKDQQIDELKNKVISEVNNIEGVNNSIFEWTNKDDFEYKISITYEVGYTGSFVYTNKGTKYLPAEFKEASDITYDMRKPEQNTYKVYGKNLKGKSFGIKMNNNDVQTEIIDGIGVENDLEFLTIKVVSSKIIDNTRIKINIYEIDDESKEVEIYANIEAFPYIPLPSWEMNKYNRLRLEINQVRTLRFIVKNFNPEKDILNVYQDDEKETNIKTIQQPILVNDKTGEFELKLEGKAVNGYIPSWTVISIDINNKTKLKVVTQVSEKTGWGAGPGWTWNSEGITLL